MDHVSGNSRSRDKVYIDDLKREFKSFYFYFAIRIDIILY